MTSPGSPDLRTAPGAVGSADSPDARKAREARPIEITTVGFDADDTLWHNERFFALTQERFAAILADYAEREALDERLLAAERRNLHRYGYGIKGFVLSMVETAVEITQERVPARVIRMRTPDQSTSGQEAA